MGFYASPRFRSVDSNFEPPASPRGTHPACARAAVVDFVVLYRSTFQISDVSPFLIFLSWMRCSMGVFVRNIFHAFQ